MIPNTTHYRSVVDRQYLQPQPLASVTELNKSNRGHYIYVKATKNNTNTNSHTVLYTNMDPINRQFMVRRLAAVKQRKCYIAIFKLIVE
ncbi:MAG: hypothetical protein ACKPKO_36805, partial [Candidatus Fonsibacter sp.]